MDNNSWSCHHQTLLTELLQGFHHAKELKSLLGSASAPPQSGEVLAQRIVSSFQNSLSILHRSGSPAPPQGPLPNTSLPESPISVNGSPPTDASESALFKQNQDLKDVPKKRKMMSQKTEHVRVSSHNGLEGPHEDGYSWRKYGQKDILGARYPRSYYRCTYRNTQSCWATKQVQRSDDDPTIFDITYKGQHTCFQATNPIPPPKSPEKQEQKQNHTIQQSQDPLSNLRASLWVNTEEMTDKQMPSPFSFSSSWGCSKTDNHTCFPTTTKDYNILDTYSPSLSSPATPDSNYFFHWQTNNFTADQNFRFLESDLAEIMSANTSKTNSPIPDMDFSLDPVEIDPNLPFHTPGYIS